MGLTRENGYEPTPRELVITRALKIVRESLSTLELSDADTAAFIEGYLQGKELAGEL